MITVNAIIQACRYLKASFKYAPYVSSEDLFLSIYV